MANKQTCRGEIGSKSLPEAIELKPLDKNNDLDTICNLITYDFGGENAYAYIKTNAQLLYNYLQVYHKGGVSLENAFCDMIEGLRENVVLGLVSDAEKLAKKANEGCRAKLQYAEDALGVDVGIDYRIPEGQFKYDWFSNARKKIIEIYNAKQKSA
jgi:hypothetical protein